MKNNTTRNSSGIIDHDEQLKLESENRRPCGMARTTSFKAMVSHNRRLEGVEHELPLVPMWCHGCC
jgi:hypothetical protein